MYAFEKLGSLGNVGGGMAEHIFIAPKAWITDLKTPVAPFAVPGDAITVKDAHVFAAGKGFLKFEAAPQKNTLGIKSKGDLGSNGQLSETAIFIPGNDIAAHELVRSLMNTPLIVLQPDAALTETGEQIVHQLGDTLQSAWFTADWESATTASGSKGFAIKITYDSGSLFYTPVIEEKA